MPIIVQCPGCGKKFQAKDYMAGKRGKCPSCGQVIVVPAGQGASQAPPPESPGDGLVAAIGRGKASEIAGLLRQQEFTLIETPEDSTEDGSAPMMADVDDFPVLVAFLSMEHARTFADAMPDLLTADGSLPAFVVTGADLLAYLPEGCGVLLNPESQDCAVLPPSLIDAIKEDR